MKLSLCISIGLAVMLFSCKAKKKITKADYQRAESFTRENIHKKVFHLRVSPDWFRDSSGFAYAAHSRDGERYYKVLLKSRKKTPAFDQVKMADALSKLSGKKVSADSLGLEHMNWYNEDSLSFSFKDKRYSGDLTDYHFHQINDQPEHDNEASSPDGKYVVFSKADNLYLKPPHGGETIALSNNGSKYYIYGSYYGWSDVMAGEDAAPVAHFTADWSPDSKKFFTQILDVRNAEKMYLLDWSKDSLYRARLLSYYRASPGDTDIVYNIPVIYNVAAHHMVKIDLPPIPYFQNAYFRWSDDGSYLYGIYRLRGYKKEDVVKIDAKTGKVDVLWTDSSKTFVENTTQFQLLEKEGFALITSEKSGWNQLYRLDWKTGKVQALTQGNYVVNDIVGVDQAHQCIYFTASGKEKGVNPYDHFLYKIDFNGQHLQLLSPEKLDHEVSLSPDNHYFVDNCSSTDQPDHSFLRSTADGSIVMKIDSADIKALLATGWQAPQVFTVTARDGKTTIYGALWKPTDFNPHHHYPLIDYTYTGPQTNVFPNTFSKALYSFYSSAQALAELGFVVMQVDGLGSAGRSKAFHNWSYKNMGNNLEDHVLAIRQLGQKYSWIDTTRVGIYGHSAGGYDAAHALEAFNYCYKVAVAESGDHDWRMEKAWWPEMYVGWPVDSVYQQQSNITMAPKLKGKLLLIHGGIDENVNPAETFKLSEALIKAGKYFNLLIIPSAHHGYPEAYRHYVTVKRWNYFVQNLIMHPPAGN